MLGWVCTFFPSRGQLKFHKRSPNWVCRNLHKECVHPNGWRDKHTIGGSWISYSLLLKLQSKEMIFGSTSTDLNFLVALIGFTFLQWKLASQLEIPSFACLPYPLASKLWLLYPMVDKHLLSHYLFGLAGIFTYHHWWLMTITANNSKGFDPNAINLALTLLLFDPP